MKGERSMKIVCLFVCLFLNVQSLYAKKAYVDGNTTGMTNCHWDVQNNGSGGCNVSSVCLGDTDAQRVITPQCEGTPGPVLSTGATTCVCGSITYSNGAAIDKSIQSNIMIQ